MERVSRIRATILLLLFCLVLVLYAGKLFRLQIIETDGNNDNTTTYTTLTTVRASRGDILDRNGQVLVGNRASYDVVFNHYVIKSYKETNEALYNLINDRLLAAKPMIVSTNLTVDDMLKRYSPQIASRLHGSFNRLTFLGEDIRVMKNRGY